MTKPARSYRAGRSREAALRALGSSVVSGVAVIALVGGLLLLFGHRVGRMDAVVDQAAPAALATATARPQVPIPVAPPPVAPVVSPPVVHRQSATGPTLPATPKPAMGTVPAVVERLPVVIFDETRHREVVLAFRSALRSAGWDVAGIGPWVGKVPVSMVYYPAGMKAQAKELMAAFPSIIRVRPAFPGVPTDKLTVIICEGFERGGAPTR